MYEGLHAVDANLLPVLLALLEERSLVRAGDRMSLSAQAVGSALARLRRHFDDPLLVRVGRCFELTPLAATVLPHVAAANEAAAALLGQSTTFDPDASTQRFTLAMSEYAMTVLGAPFLRRLATEAPRCSAVIETLPAATTDRWAGALLRCDVVVGPEHEAHPGRARTIYTEELVCIVAAGHPRLRDGGLGHDDLAALPRAVVPGDHLDSRRHLVAAGLLSLPHLVAGTDAWALVPLGLARRAAATLDLVIADTPLPRRRLAASALWHPRRETDPAGRWLRRCLAAIGAEVEAALESSPGPAPATRDLQVH